MEPVTEELVKTNENVAPAAIDGVVIVTCPERPLSVAVVVPEAVPELSTMPFPAAEETKFPAVTVMFPEVAVMDVPALTAPAVADTFPVVAITPVPPVTVPLAETFPAEAAMFPVVAVMPVPPVRVVVVVNEPGVVIAEGRLTVATFATVLTVI